MKSKETFRYDKEEDRANDIKSHDNPKHPGKRSHDKRVAETEEELKEYTKQDIINIILEEYPNAIITNIREG